MTLVDQAASGIVRRLRPTGELEGGYKEQRLGVYGETVVEPYDARKAADEGSYYVVTNPTIDTAVAFGVIAAYAATTPMFLVVNTAASGGRNIVLDYLKMLVTVAPASATNWKFLVELDSTQRLSTAPTGGVNRTAGVFNANISRANDFEGQVWVGTGGTVLTVMAATAARIVSHGRIAESIPLVLDEMMIVFGQQSGGQAAPATAVTRRVGYSAPVVIPPSCSAAIHMYGASNAITGISFEYELGMWQR